MRIGLEGVRGEAFGGEALAGGGVVAFVVLDGGGGAVGHPAGRRIERKAGGRPGPGPQGRREVRRTTLRRHEEPEGQAGREAFGEAVDDDGALGCQGGERAQIVAQKAVDGVLDREQIVPAQDFGQPLAAGAGHGEAERIVQCGLEIDGAQRRGVLDRFGDEAVGVHRQRDEGDAEAGGDALDHGVGEGFDA